MYIIRRTTGVTGAGAQETSFLAPKLPAMPLPDMFFKLSPTLEWKLKARWKTVTFGAPERELAVRDIAFRAEQPMNSAAYKEAVLPTTVREVNNGNAGPSYHMHSCGCLNGLFELKATDECTDSAEAHDTPALVSSELHEGGTIRDSCCGYLPPFGGTRSRRCRSLLSSPAASTRWTGPPLLCVQFRLLCCYNTQQWRQQRRRRPWPQRMQPSPQRATVGGSPSPVKACTPGSSTEAARCPLGRGL